MKLRLLLMVSVAVSLLFSSGRLNAQTSTWQPSAGHTQVPIWPGKVPDAQPSAGPESAETVNDPNEIVAGKPWLYVQNVSRPTLTLYSPSGKNTGAAVVVFPGGGYQGLAIDLEGTEVCDWLTSKGITCVLLKYRVPHTGPYWDRQCNCEVFPKSPMALEDAQRTVGLVRFHGAEFQIDPHKVGVLGFSAGGHLAAAISTHFQKRVYPAVDAADNASCRPDFAVVLYPGHLRISKENPRLNPDIRVTRNTPPTFLLQATDDPVDSVDNSLLYYNALRNVGVPVEMHLFAQGGHGFGLRPTDLPITHWPQLVEAWLRTISILPQ
jgi:acetyl esterase/lipase